MEAKRVVKLFISVLFLCLIKLKRCLLRQGGKGDFVILYYHGIPEHQKDAFAWQMDQVKKDTTPVHAHWQGEREGNQLYCAVTFDDAYVSITENALPALEKRRIPSTVFAPTGCLGQRPSWEISLGSPDLDEMVMDEKQLKSIASDQVIIGSHSIHHPNFLALSEEDSIKEVVESRKTLETALGKPVKLFSFPHGKYNQQSIEHARAAGYEQVFSITPDLARLTSNEYVTGRVKVTPEDWPLEFKLKLMGMYRWLPMVKRLLGNKRGSEIKLPKLKEPAVIDLSVVIVNWNTKDLLLQCIASILEQTKESSLEIIVVDNNSTDGSQEAVKEAYPKVRLICNRENLGFAKANNIGILKSKGRYVCLVNSDIVALDQCLDKMRAYMDRQQKIGALGPKTVNEHFQLRKNAREFPSLRNLLCQALFLERLFPNTRLMRGRVIHNYDFDYTREVDVLSGCCLMLRREALEQVGLLDEIFFIYGEDVDWGKRFNASGWRTVLHPEAEAIHIGGASSSIQSLRFLKERLKADLKYWKKHHSFFAHWAYRMITIFHYGIRALGWFGVFLVKRTDTSRNKLKSSLVQAGYYFTNNGK